MTRLKVISMCRRAARRAGVALFAMTTAALLSLPLVADDTKPAGAMQAGPGIRISGVGLKTLALSPADLDRMPRKTVKTVDHDTTVTFEGWPVGDLLRKAGFSFGQQLRGPRMADYLTVTSAEGYRVVFALPELDTEFTDRVVLLADKENGKPFAERDGPYRIIVSDEKKHARWVRNAVSLNVATSSPDKATP